MAEIRWTDEAVKWLQDIFDYIAVPQGRLFTIFFVVFELFAINRHSSPARYPDE